MKISGFTFVKNATKLYFPIKESILSVLPICDEFIVALGDCDNDDKTREEILSINSSKIKIVDTTWDTKKYNRNTEYARQTDIAKEACTGDWLFYIQSDEAIHEKFLPIIKQQCERHLKNPKVEGFLFGYKHFWGDFFHHQVDHSWYPCEIRVIRNNKNVHSWRDAQSFRYFESFDYSPDDYLRKEGARKLSVIELPCEIYHYGCVRPPHLMGVKTRKADETYHGKEEADRRNKDRPQGFDYGPMRLLAEFKGNHPEVMKDWIAKFNWGDKLNYGGSDYPERVKHTHEKLKNRILTFLEQNLLGGKQIGGFKNYEIVKKKDLF